MFEINGMGRFGCTSASKFGGDDEGDNREKKTNQRERGIQPTRDETRSGPRFGHSPTTDASVSVLSALQEK